MQYTFKAEFFKALAHPLRIQILDALRGGPLNVTELRDQLGVEQSTLSPTAGRAASAQFGAHAACRDTIRYEVRDPAIWRLLDSAREIFDNQLVDVRGVLESMRSES